MNDRNLSDLCPALQDLCQKWLDACRAAGLKPIITQTWRSYAEQDSDYAQGRSAPGSIITNAKGGQSPHNCTSDGTPTGNPASQAFDFALYGIDGNELDWDATDPQWQKAIAIGKGLGLISGGDFHALKDYPHMEMPNWNLTSN